MPPIMAGTSCAVSVKRWGYSPKDCTKYECNHGHYCGHLKFSPNDLKNAKRRDKLATCTTCQERKTKLLKILRARDCWKCKCPKVRTWREKKHGIKNPGKHWLVVAWLRSKEGRHAEAVCPLIPQTANEMRWEGQNKGITEDDMSFLLRADPW